MKAKRSKLGVILENFQFIGGRDSASSTSATNANPESEALKAMEDLKTMMFL